MDFINEYDEDLKRAKIFSGSDDGFDDDDFDFSELLATQKIVKAAVPAATYVASANEVYKEDAKPSESKFPEDVFFLGEELSENYDEDELEAMREAYFDAEEVSSKRAHDPVGLINNRTDLSSFKPDLPTEGDFQPNKKFRTETGTAPVGNFVIDNLERLVSETSINYDDCFSKKPHVVLGGTILEDSEKIISYYNPSEFERFVTATNSIGKTLFVPRRSKSKKIFDASFQKKLMASSRQLISGSMFQLLDKIETEVKTAETKVSSHEAHEESMGDANIRNELWVEKYRPRTFLDLKGDQRLNREALEWLKSWDRCVFPSTSRIPNKRFISQPDETTKFTDAYHRPEKKIMLLSGPPGLGKTSLAHVLARQCGYNCIEINASDDRTAATVRDRITNAIEMKAVFGDKRPNLVVIDEIDGVSSAGGSQNFISLLIQMATSGNETGDPKKKGKVLRRPIICICNDQFAPALRQLRPHCQIFTFKRLATVYTAEHLKEICENEGIKSNSYTLTTLSELTGGDFRSSINTLQFLAESHKTITYDMVANGQTGVKDSPKSLFGIWDSIFRLPTGKQDEMATQHFDYLVKMILTHGGFRIILEGCFENYLNARYIDTYMDKLCSAGEWMIWYDSLDLRINTQQQNPLFPYLPYPIVAFHSLFASASARRIDFPKLDRQFRDDLKSNSNLLASFHDALPPFLRCALSKECLVNYFIHLALQIIEPDVSRFNLQILRPAEKAIISHVVQRMATLNIQYCQARSPEGQLTYELDPPLDLLLSLGKQKEVAFQFFPAARNELKQHILYETEKEVIRRKEVAWQARNLAHSNRPAPKSSAPAFTFKKQSIANPSPAPTELTSPKLMFMPLIPKPIISSLSDAKTKTRKNPFAAFKIQPSPSSSQRLSQLHAPTKVWFKFLDGYSNAVRTPLYMNDL